MKIIQSKFLIKTPLVSVVIPSYNRANTVGKTITHILNQQCNFEFEIVIGDDCSNDETRSLLVDYQQKYPKSIKLLFYEKNIGLAANWATCIQNCNGEYIANCDNDDWWHNPQKLQIEVDFLEKNADCGMVHTDYRTENSTTGKFTEFQPHSIKYEGKIIDVLLYQQKFCCCNSSVMYRAALLQQFVPLPDYKKYQFTLQDWGTWVFLAKHTRFCCLPVSTTTVLTSNSSITRPQEYETLLQRMLKEKEFNQYIAAMLPDDYTYNETDAEIYIYHVLLALAYKKADFNAANGYAKMLLNLGEKKLKNYVACCKWSFFIFIKLKKLKYNE